MSLTTRVAAPVQFGPAAPARPRTTGMGWLLASELAAGLVGFAVVVRWARILEPAGFAHVEYASAVAAWMLVVVRGGIDLIVYREAARCPRLIHELTRLLIGLRAVCALAGYAIVIVLAALVGRERGAVVALAGVVLLPSALVSDVLPRATGRLAWVALAQLARSACLAAAGLGLVWQPAHLWRAALCLALAEAATWLVMLAVHTRTHGIPWPRFRPRAWRVLAHRGAVASLIRFGRVSLYAADVLALGWLAGAQLGPYAAARRLVFAIAALGLVVPTALAPAIARAWMDGSEPTRALVGQGSAWLWALALPAALGLALLSGRWMPALFGPAYRSGGAYLAIVAARLPWLLSASFSQATLIACRREREALRVVAGMTCGAALLLPLGLVLLGPLGAGLAALIVECAGAAAGWWLLRALGAAGPWRDRKLATLAACLAMAAVCWALWSVPLLLVCVACAAVYALAWLGADLLMRRLRAGEGGCP